MAYASAPVAGTAVDVNNDGRADYVTYGTQVLSPRSQQMRSVQMVQAPMSPRTQMRMVQSQAVQPTSMQNVQLQVEQPQGGAPAQGVQPYPSYASLLPAQMAPTPPVPIGA